MTISEIVENLLDAAIRVHIRKAVEQGLARNLVSNKRDTYGTEGQQILSLFLGNITLFMGLHIIPPMNGLNWNTRLIVRRADGYYDITGIA